LALEKIDYYNNSVHIYTDTSKTTTNKTSAAFCILELNIQHSVSSSVVVASKKLNLRPTVDIVGCIIIIIISTLNNELINLGIIVIIITIILVLIILNIVNSNNNSKNNVKL